MGSLSLLISLPVFLIGLAVGSFINVVVMRSLRGEDFILGRSHCDQCGRELCWYELVPLLSFIFLRGRCRTCQAEIDIMHPIVEFLTGALFVWWWLIGFAFFKLTTTPFLQIIQPVFWLTAATLLLIILVMDWRSSLLPDWAITALFGITIIYRLLLIGLRVYQPADLALSMFGAGLLLLFFLFLWLITKKRGFGFGDVKLIFPLSLLMGWPKMFVGVWLAFVIGAICGLIFIFLGKKKMGHTLPFAPFLIGGAFLSLLYGQSLLSWYLSLL